jgi:nucleotide-binding universal stress UspA family protein
MPEPNEPNLFSDPARCILHPTDFSPESQLALAHALRLALLNKAELILLHVGAKKDSEDFPSVREMLQRWGRLDPGAPRSEVANLGIGIRKIEAFGPTVVGAIANYLDHQLVDLLVMATQGRRGLSAWSHPSTAEETARRTDVPTLFVPAECRGCVSLEDGSVSMHQIVVPVDHEPRSEEAVERGLRALRGFGDDVSKLTMLYVGDESRFPNVRLANVDWNVRRVCRRGTPVNEILAEAKESEADLLIMTTEGRQGFLDVLRGSTTEKVLRGAMCPLLAVPATA